MPTMQLHEHVKGWGKQTVSGIDVLIHNIQTSQPNINQEVMLFPYQWH